MPTGVKYDQGKAPVVQGFLHYFPRAIKAAAEISRYGKEKYEVEYADAGWRSVPDGVNRYTDGDGRHLVDEAIDGLYDPESGLLHAAHHLWNAAARLELMLREGVPLRDPAKQFGSSVVERANRRVNTHKPLYGKRKEVNLETMEEVTPGPVDAPATPPRRVA